jgi:hypothetical protein
MANNKDQNEDPEEEKKNQFDEDDDFGLPDLDYDELDEESDDDLSMDAFIEEELQDDEVMDEIAEAKTEATLDEKEEDVFGEDDDWEKQLEAELEDELKSGEFGEEVESFYQEESFDEFDSETTNKTKVDAPGVSVFSGDITPDPVKEAPKQESYTAKNEAPKKEVPFKPQYGQYLDNGKSNKSKLTKIIIIGVVLFAVVASVFLYFDKMASKKVKPVAKVEKPVAKEPVAEVVEPVVEAPKEVKKAVANTVAAGEIIKLDQATGKTYVIIASFFDDDMAMDYANKLSAQGKSPYIIPPFKDHRYYRVAIAEYNTFADASGNLEGFKQEYATEVWPLKY